MKKIASWIGTVLFIIGFGSVLIISHIAQVIGLLFGYEAHKFAADSMVWWATKSLYLTGAKVSIDKKILEKLPENRPLIIISNHQSMFDITLIGMVLQKYHPKYISKAELGKGIPAISINLKRGGSLLIDRKKKQEAALSIRRFGKGLEATNRSAVIFAEGTRTRDGSVKPFRKTGIIQLMETMPSAIILPVAMENAWKVEKNKIRPIPFGLHIKFSVLEPIDRNNMSPDEVVEQAEKQIRARAERDL